MVTLGKKEAVFNSASQFPLVPAPTASLLSIKGFGAFNSSHIISATAQRYIPGSVASLTITAPDAAALGILAGEINVPVVVHIRVNTSRYSSEWATDFIRRGRPFIFEILVNGGETATVIMNKLYAMFDSYNQRFNLADRGLPFTATVPVTGTTTLTLKDPFLSFHNNVEFLPRTDSYGSYGVKAVTTRNTLVNTAIVSPAVSGATTIAVTTGTTAGLKVGDTVVAGAGGGVITDILSSTTFTVSATTTIADLSPLYVVSHPQEPTFDGKYLEENVRMSLYPTSHSYAISPNETPKLTGGYTSITFSAWDDSSGINNAAKKHSFLGDTRGELGGRREFTFTLYFLEGSDLFNASGTVESIMTFLFNALNPTVPKMYLANGNTVLTVADFMTNTY